MINHSIPYKKIVKWAAEMDLEVKTLYHLYSEYSSIMAIAEEEINSMYKRGEGNTLPSYVTSTLGLESYKKIPMFVNERGVPLPMFMKLF